MAMPAAKTRIRKAFVMSVDAGREQEYERRHRPIWPELEAVLKRYYRGVEKVLILKIDTEKLYAKLVKEPSTNNEMYPHLYGRLNHNAVVDIEERTLDIADATF